MFAKPWPVAIFEQERSHLTRFIRDEIVPLLEDPEYRRIVVLAPVKCGKREMVEYIAMRDQVDQPTRVHAFLSAFHRTADEDQRDELRSQNLQVFSIRVESDVERCLAWIRKQRFHRKSIVLHWDECDYGTGSKQMMSKVWQTVRDIPRATNILYSATPEEVLCSSELEHEEHEDDIISSGVFVKYTPPEGYCGAERFLDARLVHEAIPFFYKDADIYSLSPQGKEIVAELCAAIARDPRRNIVVLRLSSADDGNRKENKDIYRFLSNLAAFPELADFLIVVDKSGDMGIKNSQISLEKVMWSSSNYWRRQASGVPILIVIDQTSSRSTEWACHDRVFATHDYRKTVQYNTVSQAQERVNHYAGEGPRFKYKTFQPIRVYGHTRTFKLSAGKIDYQGYITNEWAKKKIDVRTSAESLYRVRDSSTHLHPSCPETGMTEIAADRLLQSLGCYAKPSLSARVTGDVKPERDYDVSWRAVNAETWDTVWPAFRAETAARLNIPLTADMRNPFTDQAAIQQRGDGPWKGQCRGWKVLDWDGENLYQRLPERKLVSWLHGIGGGTIERPMRRFICYKDGVLGVFFGVFCGTHLVDSLHTINSMYR